MSLKTTILMLACLLLASCVPAAIPAAVVKEAIVTTEQCGSNTTITHRGKEGGC